MTLPQLRLPPTRYVIGVEGDAYTEDRLMHGLKAWDDNAVLAYAEQAVAQATEQLRAELEREHADHQETLRDVDTLVAAERERCAALCDRTGNDHCAAAIRALRD